MLNSLDCAGAFQPDSYHSITARRAKRPGRLRSITQCYMTSGNPYPTNPPFYVISHGYDMDITTSGISFGKMSYLCNIHVIFAFQKRYIWIYLGYPKLKNCIWYIPGIYFHVICYTYPSPIHVISL